jgi:hypothetical protein
VADRTLLFGELLVMPNLRAKTYVVHEGAQGQASCIELSARRLEDWFFARKWVPTGAGRRLLFWQLDEVEARGFRFHVARSPGLRTGPPEEPWERAARQWAGLSPDEQRLHAALFPDEERLLRLGYDWDHAGVYRSGEKLAPDASGRILEDAEGFVHEWVKVVQEFTWRRFPLYASKVPVVGAAGSVDPIRGT